MSREQEKAGFLAALRDLTDTLGETVSTSDGQWTVKGFIDVYRSIYTISADTKIISKILEIHLFPKLLSFAEHLGFGLVLADHQNYYPDISFVKTGDPGLKFAVDIKTTYRQEDYPDFCNGFTLGSHGEYFINRNSAKNIQFPYGEYAGHFCMGIIWRFRISCGRGSHGRRLRGRGQGRRGESRWRCGTVPDCGIRAPCTSASARPR